MSETYKVTTVVPVREYIIENVGNVSLVKNGNLLIRDTKGNLIFGCLMTNCIFEKVGAVKVNGVKVL